MASWMSQVLTNQIGSKGESSKVKNGSWSPKYSLHHCFEKRWGKSSLFYGWRERGKEREQEGEGEGGEEERKRERTKVRLLTKSGWYFLPICSSLGMTDSLPYLNLTRPQYQRLQTKASDWLFHSPSPSVQQSQQGRLTIWRLLLLPPSTTQGLSI